MGRSISKGHFNEQDFDRFAVKIRENLRALKYLLSNADFGIGEQTIGAELELYLVDEFGRPSPCNSEILRQARDPQLTPELNRFNLEYNLNPQKLAGRPFLAFEEELAQKLTRLAPLAAAEGGELVPIGILPTLSPQWFGQHMMTDLPRYHAMDNALRELRGNPFEIHIEGDPPLNLRWNDVTLEGANTSYQLHLRVNPNDFSNTYNALQLVTPVALGLAANSPTLFGHYLWEETRIALFKQSIDCRDADKASRKYPSRVYYGNGWTQGGPVELFESTVALFPPIMPDVDDEDPITVATNGGVPHLYELKLHQGSTWPWNRAIFDHHEGGHIRIEARSLPAGPSMIDMSSNAAFLLGSALALKESMPDRINILPFRCAEENFYRAAREGLDAVMLWPSSSKIQMVEYQLTELAERLIPLASEALINAGMVEREVMRLMSPLESRLKQRTNGARWQKQTAKAFESRGCSRDEAMARMFGLYRKNYHAGIPLCQWSTDI